MKIGCERDRDEGHDGRHLPDRANPSGHRGSGGRDIGDLARRPLLPRSGQRRGAQRAHLRGRWPESPPIVVSGFGAKATELAARIGDGYCTVAPDAESVRLYRDKAGNGGFVQGGMTVCSDADEVPCGPDVDRHVAAIKGLRGCRLR